MRCFDVPKTHYVTHLRMRKPSEDSKDLLLAWVLRMVYFYDHEKGTVTVVDRERWKNATGVITDYTTALKTLSDPLLPVIDGKLIYCFEKTGNRIVPTKGETCMRVSVSLKQNLVAALTCDTNAEKDPKHSEKNYVELFTYPGGEPVGNAYELPFTEFTKIELLCWSSADTHLVVATSDQDKICIIELPDVKRQKDVKRREDVRKGEKE